MLSVIIPIYNTENYLLRCLKSITKQSYKDFEVLLIDDGSTDDSPNICKKYCEMDSRFIYMRIDNGGQGRARNYGLDNAKGDWIAFVDSDDWVVCDMFETMVSFAEKEKADIVLCSWERDHGFKRIKQARVKDIIVYNNNELMRAYLTTPYILSSVWNKIYKKEMWENIRFPAICSREDMAVMYKVLSKANKSIQIPESYYIQYVRPGSTERSTFNVSKVIALDVSREMKRFIIEKYPSLTDEVALRPAKYCASLMGELLGTFSLKENREIYQRLYNELCEELNGTYSEEVLLSEDYRALCDVRDNQNNFKRERYLKGAKDSIVDILKVIYGNIVKQKDIKS